MGQRRSSKILTNGAFMQTFLFYDIETSGLNPAFDQILTFAAIRTDLQLNEIGREDIVVRLRPDIVPSPEAFITHRLTLEELNAGFCEYDAARRIHDILNTPGTLSTGYNSLGFDDEFLRFTFYRNLLDPYTHQYAHGCSRMDILPVTILYRIFKPWVLKWPVRNGRNSLKLELISKKNSLVSSGRAHDAMVDVEATLSLARALYKEKAMWDYSLDFFDKKKDQARIDQIERTIHIGGKYYRLCIMVALSFGGELMYMAPVLSIGESRKYPNQSLWLRLDHGKILPEKPEKFDAHEFDKAESGQANSDVQENNLFVIRKRYGDAKIVIPPADRFWNRLSKKQQETCKKNLDLIAHRNDFFQEFVKYHQNYEYPFIPDLDTDASLYQSGFFSKKEKKEMNLFHDTSVDGKIKLLTTLASQLNSLRIRTLAYRILFRNYPDYLSSLSNAPLLLTDETLTYMEKLRSPKYRNAIRGFRNDSKLDCHSAIKKVHRMKETNKLDQEQLEILDWLVPYIKAI